MVDQMRGRTFDVPDQVGNANCGWHSQQHVNMVDFAAIGKYSAPEGFGVCLHAPYRRGSNSVWINGRRSHVDQTRCMKICV